MEHRNGYFQLIMNNGSTFVRLFPAVGGGEMFSLAELKDYLSLKGFTKYDQINMNNVYASLKEETDVLIDDKENYAVQESFDLTIAPNKMTAVARFYPPSNFGASYTFEEIMEDLTLKKIKVGVDEEVIRNYLENKCFCKNYVIARGIDPIQGTDASIEYFFNTNPNVKPEVKEDGSVNFFNLQTISSCKKGQVLARLTREDPGRPGINVCGERVMQRTVKKGQLKYARNIALDEDGLQLIAQVSGHVSLVDDKVFVSDVYEVNDVDTSTGNIEYAGSVMIKGNVRTGFSVKAEGNIEVSGVVEGAVLEAGGNIIIARGVNGMGRGILKANGNVISKFIENANVSSGGYVQAEAILHSKVAAKGDIEVIGRKANITGGSICSGTMISAKTIGSTMGTDTFVEVGIDPTIKARYNQLQAELIDAKKNVNNMQPILTTLTKKLSAGEKLSPDQIKYLQKLAEGCKMLQQKIESHDKELEDLAEIMSNDTVAQIKVLHEIYPGTKITISDVSMYVKQVSGHCRFIKSQGDVKMVTL